ncbi:MAG TPA: S8/S53 family peptidase [Ktedonobacteraceae bacterium]
MEESQHTPENPMPLSAVVRWHANQMAVTHHSPLDITTGKQEILKSLDFAGLNKVLLTRSGYHLESFTRQDLPHPAPKPDPDDHDDDDSDDPDPEDPTGVQNVPSSSMNMDSAKPASLESPSGKYLFPHPSGKGTLVISFFHLRSPFRQKDGTLDIVHLINGDADRLLSSSDQFSAASESEAKLLAAMPNWLTGGTPISAGCPVVPPIPANDVRLDLNWHIELPAELPAEILNATGKGVHVFVLDTVPTQVQIFSAMLNGASNTLLQDLVEHVDFHYSFLPELLEQPGADQPATGTDIYARLIGFRMNDHGVFIAGIIRDLAPDAQVECMRVLNDYAVGDTLMLTHALSTIQNRLLPLNPDTNMPGDLFETGARVVVNLSLTFPPEEESLAQAGFTDQTIAPARLGSLLPMQALARYGVVFTASSGNGSGRHHHMGAPAGTRLRPDYPAAFAYPLPGVETEYILSTMIPVGAVNQGGQAASYSNYPGPEGIGAYGGEIPQPIPEMWNPSIPTTTVRYPVDALRGVYTNTRYSALSKDDTTVLHSPAPFSYPEYERAPESTWVYWVGTSFATPIISALAARVLETQEPSGDSVRQTLRAAAPGIVDWTHLDTGENNVYGPMILIWQSAREDQAAAASDC